MMLFNSETKKLKYFLDPPPPKKKAQGYERPRYGYTHKCLSIPTACDLDFYLVDILRFGAVKLQSNPFIENCY